MTTCNGWCLLKNQRFQKVKNGKKLKCGPQQLGIQIEAFMLVSYVKHQYWFNHNESVGYIGTTACGI